MREKNGSLSSTRNTRPGDESYSYERMSRAEFCKSMDRFCCEECLGLKVLIVEYKVTLALVVSILVCFFVPSLIFLYAIMLPVMAYYILTERYENFNGWLKSSAVVRRLHDFGVSAKFAFLVPFALFVLSILWISSYKNSEIEAIYSRLEISEVEKRYYEVNGVRDAEWEMAETAVIENANRAYHIAVGGIISWYAALILLCCVIPGSRSENRYGMPPQR